MSADNRLARAEVRGLAAGKGEKSGAVWVRTWLREYRGRQRDVVGPGQARPVAFLARLHYTNVDIDTKTVEVKLRGMSCV
jgi:hypothetical protein